MPSFSEAAPSDQFPEPRYLDATQVELPHVVKFSGGRSSAAMTLLMARNDLLDPNRGDVVLFANTTTEHPTTYEFAARVCDEIEFKQGYLAFGTNFVQSRWRAATAGRERLATAW